jgi:O-antigen/teichoic acid export membrane protein
MREVDILTDTQKFKTNTGRKRIVENLKRFEVDRPVFFGLLTRIWGLGAGPVTAILIATYFSPEIQGYYYTFATILALQVFVELGLGTVTVQFASHEWAKLNLDESGHIVGDRTALSRLASIANITTKWFFIGSILVTLGLGIGGYAFFSSTPSYNINWLSPWILLCFVTGVTICLVPVWSLLEGCNQVAKLYTFRFFQGALISITIWIAIFSGAGLWTASIWGVVSLFCALFFLRRNYWVFFKTLLLTKSDGAKISWHSDMLPMQWRIALSWISGYFCFSLFTPVLFKYHGPIVAGQMGMTWGIVGLVGSISGSWIAPRIPQFGMLIAEKRYDDLDRLFWKITRIVIVITFFIALLIWSGVYLLNIINHPTAFRFSSRLLPPLATAFFLLGQFLQVVSTPFSSYLRAHKKEPMMVVSVSSAILIALATLILGKYYSALGVSIGYFLTHLIVVPFVFLIWVRCRKRWHVV